MRRAWWLALFGLALGAVAQVVITRATGPLLVLAIIASTRALWCAPAFLVGTRSSTILAGVISAVVVELMAVLGYYLAYQLVDPGAWSSVWSGTRSLAPDAALVGVVFGPAGVIAASATPARWIGRMSIPAAVLIESISIPEGPLIDGLSRHVTSVELTLAALALAGMCGVMLKKIWQRAVRWTARRTGANTALR